MTRDEIRLVVFILSAIVAGALVQHCRTRLPFPAPPAPPAHGWAKPPYVLKEKAGSRGRTVETDAP